MGDGQDQGLLHAVVGQRNHAAAAFEKPQRLQIPAGCHFDKVAKAVPLRGQFFRPLFIPSTCPIRIRFFFDQFHRQIHVTQPFHIRLQQTAEEDHPGRAGQEIGIAVDPVHALQELRECPFGGRPCDRLGR